MKRPIIPLLALVALTAARCGGGGGGGGGQAGGGSPSPTATETGPAADCVETSELVAEDNHWDPVCLIASQGQEVTVTNEGDASHTFTIPDSDVDFVLEPGDEVRATIPGGLDVEAENEFHCRFHGGMVGYLYVQ
jgi:plastocyanin